ncbi:hypothetical protein DET49_11881 [Salegentibacter sp. 24]|nr:hypothetical protein DET49_11881 [Salegentibacter sp. 24]
MLKNITFIELVCKLNSNVRTGKSLFTNVAFI